MSYKITESVVWTGKIDWELRTFHGEELSTHKGSSYNSYLVKDEKTALIDTVYVPFADEFLSGLKKEIDINRIDYIIANHGEPDHSGALPLLLEIAPEIPVYCTANGAKSLKGYYHKDWNFKIVKTGDRLSLGAKELLFIETPLLHWPDSMACYLTGDEILFSNDMFGQHYASEFMTDDKVSAEEVDFEAMKYWANIIQPFSTKALKKIAELSAMNLPIKMICPSHGVIRKKNPAKAIELYNRWANSYKENQITLVYDTMYNSTRLIAEAIASGIRSVDTEASVKLFNVARSDRADLITDVFRSKAVLVGSPVVNGGLLSHVAAFLEDLKNMGLSGKKAGAFISYGWSPAALKQINEKLVEAGFEQIGDGAKAQWRPNEDALEECRAYGRSFAEKLRSEHGAQVNE